MVDIQAFSLGHSLLTPSSRMYKTMWVGALAMGLQQQPDLAISILIFLVRAPFYRHKVPIGSPFTNMSRVLVLRYKEMEDTAPSDPKNFMSLTWLNMLKSIPKQSVVKTWFMRSMDAKYGNPKMRRLGVAKDHGVMVNGGRVPLSIFILLPQFVLMGVADAFLAVAQIEFFNDQPP
ncbi:hypothetical protein IFM89_028222 [Coptis chinensis]|uniref:Uncharacterized protein n=1 Tax=Coptis chinensis TaxID=261450 RepID=A0A835IQP3_9MAGN|nr:hypothetical protein IFM89_028222 [Coptis chinensis]